MYVQCVLAYKRATPHTSLLHQNCTLATYITVSATSYHYLARNQSSWVGLRNHRETARSRAACPVPGRAPDFWPHLCIKTCHITMASNQGEDDGWKTVQGSKGQAESEVPVQKAKKKKPKKKSQAPAPDAGAAEQHGEHITMRDGASST